MSATQLHWLTFSCLVLQFAPVGESGEGLAEVGETSWKLEVGSWKLEMGAFAIGDSYGNGPALLGSRMHTARPLSR